MQQWSTLHPIHLPTLPIDITFERLLRGSLEAGRHSKTPIVTQYL